MEDKKIVGMAINLEFARWAYRETYPGDAFKKPEALDDTGHVRAELTEVGPLGHASDAAPHLAQARVHLRHRVADGGADSDPRDHHATFAQIIPPLIPMTCPVM